MLELTGGKGADLVVEASGYDSLWRRCTITCASVGALPLSASASATRFRSSSARFKSKSLTIKGTIGSPGVWPAALRFLARTKLDLSPI